MDISWSPILIPRMEDILSNEDEIFIAPRFDRMEKHVHTIEPQTHREKTIPKNPRKQRYRIICYRNTHTIIS